MPPAGLRGRGNAERREPYPLDGFSGEIINEMGGHIARHPIAGHPDTGGARFEKIFVRPSAEFRVPVRPVLPMCRGRRFADR